MTNFIPFYFGLIIRVKKFSNVHEKTDFFLYACSPVRFVRTFMSIAKKYLKYCSFCWLFKATLVNVRQ